MAMARKRRSTERGWIKLSLEVDVFLLRRKAAAEVEGDGHAGLHPEQEAVADNQHDDTG